MSDAPEQCQRCHKFRAKYIIDIRAAVTILDVRLCGRCTNKILREHPASQAVNLPQYEEQGKSWTESESRWG